MINKDNILIVILLFIVVYYLTALFIMKLCEVKISEADANKEIIIYILGIVSGGIANNKNNDKTLK